MREHKLFYFVRARRDSGDLVVFAVAASSDRSAKMAVSRAEAGLRIEALNPVDYSHAWQIDLVPR